MMLRILMGIYLGLSSWVLFAEDDMDWADVDAVVEGDRDSEARERARYLEEAIGQGAALVGLDAVMDMEIDMDDRLVPDVDQAQPSAGMPVMFEEEDDERVERARALLERMQHLQEAIAQLDEEVRIINQHEAVRRIDRAEFIRYATPAAQERLVPEVTDVRLPLVEDAHRVTPERGLFAEMQRRMFWVPALDAALGSI